jgi:hypothetical protein
LVEDVRQELREAHHVLGHDSRAVTRGGTTYEMRKKKPVPLSVEALARKLAENERRAAFRNLDKMTAEYMEWLEVLDADRNRMRAARTCATPRAEVARLTTRQ